MEAMPENGSDAASVDSAASPAHPGLSPQQVEVLTFESQLWKHAGAKEEAIRARFGLSAARYYQVLNATLDEPAATVFDPMLVKRLQRVRAARTEARSTRSFGQADRAVDL
ncbi:hypothetical protein BH09ACT1_BH09ACT1_02940 [soil metagenome]